MKKFNSTKLTDLTSEEARMIDGGGFFCVIDIIIINFQLAEAEAEATATEFLYHHHKNKI